MDDERAGLQRALLSGLTRLIVELADLHNPRAKLVQPAHLDGRRASRHEDLGAVAELSRCERHAQSMVASRCRQHADLRHIGEEQPVESTARLERPGMLENLELEEQLRVR